MNEIPIPIMRHMLANSEAGRPQCDRLMTSGLPSGTSYPVMDTRQLADYLAGGYTITITQPKPRTTIIDGQELVCALTEAPEVGVVYYFLHSQGDVGVYEWRNDGTYNKILASGNVFAEREHAEAWIPVRAKLTRGELSWPTK